MCFCELDYMCTYNIFYCIMHNYPLAQKYGECSLLFSYGTKMFQLEGNLGGRQSLACTNGSVREAREMLGWFQNCVKYVLRDSWTKLNVFPAKIMQVLWYTCSMCKCIKIYCTHVHKCAWCVSFV